MRILFLILPERIEQYAELVDLSRQFATLQTVKRQGIEKFFGHLTIYRSATDENGQIVMVPESSLSETVRNEQEANRQIAYIEVEYALDGYNEFYEHATGLLSAYMGGDIKACTEAILSFFGN